MAVYHFCGADGRMFKATRTERKAYTVCQDPLKPANDGSFNPCRSCPLYLVAQWDHHGDVMHDPETRAPLNSLERRRARGQEARRLQQAPISPQPDKETSTTRTLEVDPIGPGVYRAGVREEDDYCEECGESLHDCPSDFWWPDQDGIYVSCPRCGHLNFFPDPLFWGDEEIDVEGAFEEDVGEDLD